MQEESDVSGSFLVETTAEPGPAPGHPDLQSVIGGCQPGVQQGRGLPSLGAEGSDLSLMAVPQDFRPAPWPLDLRALTQMIQVM